MANPSPSAIAAIQSRVSAASSWSQADAAILADLKADTVANPTPQGTIPKAFTAEDLAAACGATNRPNLAQFVAGSAAALIHAQDRTHLADGLRTLKLLGAISDADVAAMQAVLDATEADPSWSATVPQIEVTIGRAIDLDDVAASRPGA